MFAHQTHVKTMDLVKYVIKAHIDAIAKKVIQESIASQVSYIMASTSGILVCNIILSQVDIHVQLLIYYIITYIVVVYRLLVCGCDYKLVCCDAFVSYSL